jgi:hypothetical protein
MTGLRVLQDRLLTLDATIWMSIAATRINRAEGLAWSLPPAFYAAWSERKEMLQQYLAAKSAVSK